MKLLQPCKIGIVRFPATKHAMTRAASILGGPKAFPREPRCPSDWIYMIRKGFPSVALDALGAYISASNNELAQLLGTSVRSLVWRRRKGVLTHYESERLFRTAQVITRAEEVFDDLPNALAWLKSPNISLGKATPFSLLDTQVGANWVMDTLGRIEHGICA
jgi:putative toxin-antitoxin system antitoxin component (TIGR02293 family)